MGGFGGFGGLEGEKKSNKNYLKNVFKGRFILIVIMFWKIFS